MPFYPLRTCSPETASEELSPLINVIIVAPSIKQYMRYPKSEIIFSGRIYQKVF